MSTKYRLKVALLMVVGLGLAGCAWLVAPAPQAVLTATPTTGEAPLDVTFDLSGSTGDITNWTLSFGDGSDPETGTALGTVDHTYAYDEAVVYPKSYTATLTVQDARGRTSTATRTITVTAPAAPVLTASLSAVDTTGNAPLGVTFTIGGEVSPPTGPKIVSWVLDYDDGDTTTGSVNTYSFSQTLAARTYNAPGEYFATLTVEDDEGNTATSAPVKVTVTSPPPTIAVFEITDAEGGDGTSDTPYELDNDKNYTFFFAADPGTADRAIESYRLHCPGSNVPEDIQSGLDEDPLTRTRTRKYVHEEADPQAYQATLTVWDDEGNSAEATIFIEVAAP